MKVEPTDPPMEPSKGSVKWFESGPDIINFDVETASWIVRLGMASNAANAQMRAAESAGRRRSSRAIKNNDINSAFLLTAALTYEATRLIKSGWNVYRPLASRLRPNVQLLERVGQLCGGSHPASALLKCARNKLAFHWDADLVEPSVRDFGKNRKIVWLEVDADSHPIHALAAAVLANALFPDVTAGTSPEQSRESVTRAMADVSSAIDLITEFSAASIYGFMYQYGVRMKDARR